MAKICELNTEKYAVLICILFLTVYIWEQEQKQVLKRKKGQLNILEKNSTVIYGGISL